MTIRTASPLCTTFLALAAFAVGAPVAAEDTSAPGIAIELSATENTGGACLMSFVATNGHPEDVQQAVFEVVLFGANGGVERLSLLDFQALPAGRPRVRQFRFDQVSCADIPRILINGAETCTGVAEGGCVKHLTLTSRTKTELIG